MSPRRRWPALGEAEPRLNAHEDEGSRLGVTGLLEIARAPGARLKNCTLNTSGTCPLPSSL
jgi:hypothetical protein